MKIKNYSDAQNYLFRYIPGNSKNIFPGARGFKRTKYLLQLLNDPQDRLNVIHIAGTSGKSSTSYLLSLLLASVNKRAGLFISPHIIDIKERIRINNKFITEDQFVTYINELIPVIRHVEESKFGKPTYFEILTTLAFYFFWKAKVDYAVVETGVGGLLDATNVFNKTNKVCIITKLGMDHTEILGKTLLEIAKQKAGIITKNSLVMSAQQKKQVITLLKSTVEAKGAMLFTLKEGVNYKNILEDESKTSFTFNFWETHFREISLGLLGKHQAENCSLALATLVLLSRRDNFAIEEKKIRDSLKDINFLGRLSKFSVGKKMIIMDGAHNKQKMESFICTLSHLYPGKRFHFLLAFKNGKDFTSILRLIIPIAERITITSFTIKTQDWLQKSVKPEEIAKSLSKLGFFRYKIIHDSQEAFEQLIHSRQKSDIIITGSFYLISVLYEKNFSIK